MGLPSAGCWWTASLKHSWRVGAWIHPTARSFVCLLNIGDFSPCASGRWYAARPVLPPGPDLILHHQLFPACSASPHASLSEKESAARYDHAENMPGPLIWLTCGEMEQFDFSRKFGNTLDPFCSLVIYRPWEGSTAVPQARCEHWCRLDCDEYKADKRRWELSEPRW